MKMKIITLIVLCVLLLNGCMKQYQPSEELTDMLAEYIAGTVLKYDKNYGATILSSNITAKVNEYVSNLMYEDSKENDLNDKVDKEKTDDKSDDKGAVDKMTDTTANSKSSRGKSSLNGGTKETIEVKALNDLYNIEGLEFSYKGYEFFKEYPKKADSYFNLSHKDGNQFLVVSFSIHNASNEKKELNLSTSDIQYAVDINKGTTYKPIMTLLEEDIHFINQVIASGEEITALLIFEVPKDAVVNSLRLNITQGNKSTIINLK